MADRVGGGAVAPALTGRRQLRASGGGCRPAPTPHHHRRGQFLGRQPQLERCCSARSGRRLRRRSLRRGPRFGRIAVGAERAEALTAASRSHPASVSVSEARLSGLADSAMVSGHRVTLAVTQGASIGQLRQQLGPGGHRRSPPRGGYPRAANVPARGSGPRTCPHLAHVQGARWLLQSTTRCRLGRMWPGGCSGWFVRDAEVAGSNPAHPTTEAQVVNGQLVLNAGGQQNCALVAR
jgi:hypothetical protein